MSKKYNVFTFGEMFPAAGQITSKQSVERCREKYLGAYESC